VLRRGGICLSVAVGVATSRQTPLVVPLLDSCFQTTAALDMRLWQPRLPAVGQLQLSKAALSNSGCSTSSWRVRPLPTLIVPNTSSPIVLMFFRISDPGLSRSTALFPQAIAKLTPEG
jgi:hypothetical protein